MYTKPANKGITLNAKSHHPSATKRAMVLNEIYPSQNYVQDATEKITNKLLNNGYSDQWIHSCTTKKKKKKKGTNNSLSSH